MLIITPVDLESGIAKVYVNGYAYDHISDGELRIRLSQFDAGYETFLVQAEDAVGNISEVYRVKNPYFKDGDSKDEGDPAKELPISAEATDPSDAIAFVRDHYIEGEDDSEETVDSAALLGLFGSLFGGMSNQGDEESGNYWDFSQIGNNTDLSTFFGGNYEDSLTQKKEKVSKKEFYTIETASGKIFYLIIDRTGDDERVYFLTNVSENDLLNVVSSTSETLPRNSAALSSGVPIVENALPRNPSSTVSTTGAQGNVAEPEKSVESTVSETKPAQPVKENKSNFIMYCIIGAVAVVVIGLGYYFKVVKKKREGGFVEEDDDGDDDDRDDDRDNEEEPETYDDDRPMRRDRDFFDDSDEEEDEYTDDDE